MEKQAGEIARMQLNGTDYLLFSVKEYKGKNYIDLRKYVVSDTYTGFTKQGVRFIADMFPEFEANLEQVKKALPKPNNPQVRSRTRKLLTARFFLDNRIIVII